MKLQLSELTTERKWRSATGMDKARFNKLLAVFKASYQERYGKSIEQKQASEKRFEFCISNAEELLYFTLFSLKSGLTYDLLGLVCGMNGGSAKKNQEIGLKVLDYTLEKQGFKPVRTLKNTAEFEKLFKTTDTLLIDATEHSRQRPKNHEQQHAHYSGKKKTIQ
ncbi:MAG: hypothetical protein SVR94_14785 [Pseudomonadota bacterium]|nr:hypothetical protein [Pseudomonadota bacterium]